MAAAAKDIHAELRAPELRGYVSDSEFNEAYGEADFPKELDTVLIVENLPRVDESKQAKLQGFVTKVFSALGKIVEDGVYMPVNKETGTTEGFAFIEFASKGDAEKALASTNGWDFDSSHKLRVYFYETARQYINEPDDAHWAPPPVHEVKVAADAYYWLLDEAGRDQFAISWHNSANLKQQEVMWSDAKRAPQLEYSGGEDREASNFRYQAWSNALAVRWSPRGGYLATFAPRGLRLWSGSKFEYGHGFAHTGVREAHFSPTEAHLLTWNGHAGNENPEAAAIVWDARTGEQLRRFKQRRPEDEDCDMVWSADGRFLARLEYDALATKSELVRVYETPALSLLDGRSMKVPGAVEISWCPAGQNILAWWSPERENAPASVQLVRFPSREIVRQRNLFNVDTLALDWHPDGAFLAVRAARAAKKRVKAEKLQPLSLPTILPGVTGGNGWTIELFRLREKDVPVQVLDVAESIRGLHWEPSGTRFALVTETPVPSAFNIAFYEMPEKATGKPALLFTLENKPYSSVVWSPRGEFCVLAGMKELGGRYEFFDVERKKSFGTAEHPNATGLTWDPSGRAVCSYKASKLTSSLTREIVDNGYQLFTFQGVKYFEAAKPKLLRFDWRPRPASLLAEEEVREVAKNLKKFITRFHEEDRKAEDRKKLLERLHRRKQRDDFRALLLARRTDWESRRAEREAAAAASAAPPSEDDVFIEEVYERVLEVTVVDM